MKKRQKSFKNQAEKKLKISNKQKFNKIVSDIKKVKIQGAINIAKAALYAYSLNPSKEARQRLMNARPTEPLLVNVLNSIEKQKYKEIYKHFLKTQLIINKNVFKLIKNNDIIYTHCHSTNVIKSLIYANQHGKKFKVFNTETRPLLQGRKTAKELSKENIKVTMFVDSAIAFALEKSNRKDKIYATKIFLGADALLNSGIINKIGSLIIAELARLHKIPLYIIADSWKYSPKNVKIEERDFHEVWKTNKHIKIKNPAFEFIDKKYITAIVSELGILSYDKFLRRVK